ncbi:AraC family transcriptional regulator [Pseudoalteromonas denitrificans]|uniref:Transcriptional regulator, AraC family n=1 Tax=Pseudoalteromonas denitrificans DSM 6059 TaxID=1123010 RepID=A0A1I1IEY5_9GAMM|nr:AraC family transcriptional regulator [Pseudoalteromonas denitrificans]SFC34887.1 transcriptional regulator, AraC family [Pseudoalteromonas denitrificans DSM 6059]
MMKPKEQAKFQLHQELGGLEMVEADFCDHNFSKHSHETYTINVIEKGAQRFLSSGSHFMAPEHSIIFVNADEVHTGQSGTDNGWSYRGIAPFESHFTKLASEIGLAQGFAPYFPNAVVQDPQMATELRQLFNTLANSDNTLLRETMLYGVLTRLMLKHGKSRSEIKQQQTSNQKLEWVKQYINDHLEQNITLETLAKISNFTPFYLVRQFQKMYGLPPHAYQIQQRLRKSKSLLRQGNKVVDVATDIGFYDQSHFHRHFKKANGVTPSRYARQMS